MLGGLRILTPRWEVRRMTQVAAVGPGPVSFSATDGTQIEVPLWEIYFEDGNVGTRRPRDASSAMLDLWLSYLAANGRLVAGEKPSQTALQFVATNPGAYGNNITVATITVGAASPRKVDITVSITDRYPDLTVDDLTHLDDLLGTQASPSKTPGVLQVKPPIPSNLTLPAVGEKPEADRTPVGGVTPPATWPIAGTAHDVLVLEPRDPGTAFDAGTTVVAMDAGTLPQSVTLVVTWSATVNGVKATDDFTTMFDSFGFLVELGDPPPDGFTLPRDGTVVLSGGTNAVDARPATVTLLTID